MKRMLNMTTRVKQTGLSNALRSRAIVAVEYQYAADGLDAGYSLTLPGGAVFTRSVARDGLRRSLVTEIASSFNGNALEGIAYSYDALGRPVARNADAFGYNERGEVTSASVMGWAPSPSTASYGYDGIGNLQQSTFNAATNTYTANSLNQYTSILCGSAPPREPTYDLDGNMLTDGALSFTYDAASRLKTVSSNGVTLVTNFYDAKSRRVKKVTPNATTTFFYDDWNLVEERIAYADNTTSTIRYYWGRDLSGTLQGAGGVGGLLWLTIDGVVYIPCYDNNGNVTRYLNANGGTFARYSYDAFGRLIARAGRRASFFRHRFSTKYFDSETGLYYYGYRFYHPILMRWLNRDPIEEMGGVNLYVFCYNRGIGLDILGCFTYRSTVWGGYWEYDLSPVPKLKPRPPMDAVQGTHLESLLDFLDGGAGVTYNYYYPIHSATVRLLEHPEVAKIWKEFNAVESPFYRKETTRFSHRAGVSDFLWDLFSVWGTSPFSMNSRWLSNYYDGDLGYEVLGSFGGEYSITTDYWRCTKRLKMTIRNDWTVASMLRIPGTSSSLLPKAVLDRENNIQGIVKQVYHYDVEKPLNNNIILNYYDPIGVYKWTRETR